MEKEQRSLIVLQSCATRTEQATSIEHTFLEALLLHPCLALPMCFLDSVSLCCLLYRYQHSPAPHSAAVASRPCSQRGCAGCDGCAIPGDAGGGL